MQQMPWNTEQLRQDSLKHGQALLSDEQTLVAFSQDFGKIIQSRPGAVFNPLATDVIQAFLHYAAHHHIPVTIRGNGLSQSGQSVAIEGGIILSMQHFTDVYELDNNAIWADANASWAKLLAKTLPHNLAPFVLPYNCNLSIAGVLSAGGIGASSFKHGTITSHVKALEVIDGMGVLHNVDQSSPLYNACLGGQGRCAVITKACIQLKPVAPKVKTFFLVYNDQELWLEDMEKAQLSADYLEFFCSPSVQGAGLFKDGRKPLVEWLYGLHISYEFEEKLPDIQLLKPWKIIHEQEESIQSYLLRHNDRFKIMKLTGQWDLAHPWYECFLPKQIIKNNLQKILDSLPLHFANFIHIVPVVNQHSGFTMFPDVEQAYEFMILNPGIIEPLTDSCLQAIERLDEFFLQQGGKRYLSGYVGKHLEKSYWQSHFGNKYEQWQSLKRQYDPKNMFTSCLFENS